MTQASAVCTVSYSCFTWPSQGGCYAFGYRHVRHEALVASYLHLVLRRQLFLQARANDDFTSADVCVSTQARDFMPYDIRWSACVLEKHAQRTGYIRLLCAQGKSQHR
jgi:hypothetical protein